MPFSPNLDLPRTRGDKPQDVARELELGQSTPHTRG